MGQGTEDRKAASAPGTIAAVPSCSYRGAIGGVAIPASLTCAVIVIAGGNTSILTVAGSVVCVKLWDKRVFPIPWPVSISISESASAFAELVECGDIGPSAGSFDDPDAEVEEVTADFVVLWRLRGTSSELSRSCLGI
jgi:hypothetical protein